MKRLLFLCLFLLVPLFIQGSSIQLPGFHQGATATQTMDGGDQDLTNLKSAEFTNNYILQKTAPNFFSAHNTEPGFLITQSFTKDSDGTDGNLHRAYGVAPNAPLITSGDRYGNWGFDASEQKIIFGSTVGDDGASTTVAPYPVELRVTGDNTDNSTKAPDASVIASDKKDGTGDGGVANIRGGKSEGGDDGFIRFQNSNQNGNDIEWRSKSSNFWRFTKRNFGGIEWRSEFEGATLHIDFFGGFQTQVDTGLGLQHETTMINPGSGHLGVFSKSDNHIYTQTTGSVVTRIPNDDDVVLADGSNKMTGNLAFTANGQGVILVSPDATCYKIEVANGGALSTNSVTCP